MTTALTFDDVQLTPKYSEIESRSTVNTETNFTKNFRIKIPIVAAPMDTVCDIRMVASMWNLGGVGALHRFMSIEEQMKQIEMMKMWSYDDKNTVICATIGANGDSMERAHQSILAGANVILIDVAHGHHINVARTLEKLQTLRSNMNVKVDFIAGNIATAQAAKDLESWGADALRVGIGGGSVCETRIRTGVGIPQLTTVQDIAAATYLPIISDGGIRYPGDIAKALAAGASTVMVGSLLAGTDEAPGDLFVAGQWPNNKKYKVYRGSASATIKMEKTGVTQHVEGASKMVECKGPVESVIKDLMDGVTSAMSYLGASNIPELRSAAEFVQISNAGLREAHPHLL
jgi:IMP dehydrogenase